MAAVTIRNVSEETLRALKSRAKAHGRSTEAEIREILYHAAHPDSRIKIGSELAAFKSKLRGIDFGRDPRPPEPADFE